MKRKFTVSLIILMAIGLVSCVEQGSTKAGSATAKSMLQLVPADSRAVVMIDVRRTLGTDAVQNALKDEKTRQTYEGFVQMAGLDPMKDIYFVAVGLHWIRTNKRPNATIIVNLNFNKDKLLAKLKEVAGDLSEEAYNGVIIYGGAEGGTPETVAPAGAFLDDSNIVLGSTRGVKAAIDVYQKKAEPVSKSPEMKRVLRSVNTAANIWAAVAVPEGLLKPLAEKNPMLKDLVELTGLTLSFDYAGKALTAEVQSLGGTREHNKTLAERLSGLKALGTLAADKLPLQGELLKTIEISSGANYVKLHASIPEEVLEKARNLALKMLRPPAQ
jgi:hypothetical protein